MDQNSVISKWDLPHHRYRWAFIPEASDDSGLEVRRQGTHQREFKPYVVRLAKLLRKRAKVFHLPSIYARLLNDGDKWPSYIRETFIKRPFLQIVALFLPAALSLTCREELNFFCLSKFLSISPIEKPRGGLLHANSVLGARSPNADPLRDPQHGAAASFL